MAIIIAGGSGKRMNQDIPKQFLNVYDKPIIIYTLETFQKHPEINGIGVVCLEGWQEVLYAYAHQFNITKLKWVVSGGATAQESIYNGLKLLEGVCSAEDIVVIHDGIRPLVEDFVLTDVINVCRKNGNAVTSLPYNEQIFLVDDDIKVTTRYIQRDTVRRVSTPQAYCYEKILNSYKTAFEKGLGIGQSTYANTLMVDLGETLYFAAGSEKNIKITTKDDLELFKAYMKMEKDAWLK